MSRILLKKIQLSVILPGRSSYMVLEKFFLWVNKQKTHEIRLEYNHYKHKHYKHVKIFLSFLRNFIHKENVSFISLPTWVVLTTGISLSPPGWYLPLEFLSPHLGGTYHWNISLPTWVILTTGIYLANPSVCMFVFCKVF